MLEQLSIKNVAVIDRLDVSFKNGVTVLTGETGAGKSIIIDSINMILGSRTNKELVRHLSLIHSYPNGRCALPGVVAKRQKLESAEILCPQRALNILFVQLYGKISRRLYIVCLLYTSRCV